ncbi:unnamed protein product [Symbiodinium sp. CCMP2456]|nr:unnamed protein product [Symbiodinium sp. CCMP2456]
MHCLPRFWNAFRRESWSLRQRVCDVSNRCWCSRQGVNHERKEVGSMLLTTCFTQCCWLIAFGLYSTRTQWDQQFEGRCLKMVLQPDVAEHLLQGDTSLQIEGVPRTFAREYVYGDGGDWVMHVRVDSSPQFNRDYLVSEVDVVSLDKTFSSELDTVMQDVGFTTRIMPLQVLGRRATNTAYKYRALLRALRLEVGSEDLIKARTFSMLHDMGVESKLAMVPGFSSDCDDRWFNKALPLHDLDHGLHNVMLELSECWEVDFYSAWERQLNTMAKHFSKADNNERFVKQCIWDNPKIEGYARKKAIAGMFKSTCPTLVPHRWQYMHDVLLWVTDRRKFLMYLDPHVVSSRENSEGRSGQSDDVISDMEAAAFKLLYTDKLVSATFWAMCAVMLILCKWGHTVVGWLHGCWCHPTQDDRAKFRKKNKGANCKWSGRRLIELSCGSALEFMADLRSLRIENSSLAMESMGLLVKEQQKGSGASAAAGPDSASDIISVGFVTAKRMLESRFSQLTSFVREPPWNLISLLQFLIVPASVRSGAVVESRQIAATMLQKFDQGKFGDVGDIGRRFLQTTHRSALKRWAYSQDKFMDLPLFRSLLAYASSLNVMQRLEAKHHLVQVRMCSARALGVAHLSANIRRALNGDLERPEFERNLDRYLSSFSSIVQEEWGSFKELQSFTTGHNLQIMFADRSPEMQMIAAASKDTTEDDPSFRDKLDHVMSLMRKNNNIDHLHEFHVVEHRVDFDTEMVDDMLSDETESHDLALTTAICHLGKKAVQTGLPLSVPQSHQSAADWIVEHELGEYNDRRPLDEPGDLIDHSLWSLRRQLRSQGWCEAEKGKRLSAAQKYFSGSNRAPSYYVILIECLQQAASYEENLNFAHSGLRAYFDTVLLAMRMRSPATFMVPRAMNAKGYAGAVEPTHAKMRLVITKGSVPGDLVHTPFLHARFAKLPLLRPRSHVPTRVVDDVAMHPDTGVGSGPSADGESQHDAGNAGKPESVPAPFFEPRCRTDGHRAVCEILLPVLLELMREPAWCAKVPREQVRQAAHRVDMSGRRFWGVHQLYSRKRTAEDVEDGTFCKYETVNVFTEFTGSACAESAVESVINHLRGAVPLNCDVSNLLDASRVSMEALHISSFLDLLPMTTHVDECQGNYNTRRLDYERMFPDMVAFDLHQSPSHRARRASKIMFPLTTGCNRVWLRNHKRFLTGAELLSLHSIPVNTDVARVMKCRPSRMESISNTGRCTLVGNSMHGASVGKVFAIALLYSKKNSSFSRVMFHFTLEVCGKQSGLVLDWHGLLCSLLFVQSVLRESVVVFECIKPTAMSDGESSSDHSDGESIKVNCLECGRLCSIRRAVKFGKRFRDPKCHSAYRWLTTNDPEWPTKTAEEKRETVIANRGQGGRGTARKLVAVHEAPRRNRDTAIGVEVDKYSDTTAAVPYLTELRFKRKGAKWYGWSEERAQEEWDKAVRDKNVKRKTDQYGNLTIAKLSEESDVSGLRVGNKRKIQEQNKHKVGDEEAIENLAAGLAQSRLDVEVKMSAASGLNLLTLSDNSRGCAKAKPQKSSKKRENPAVEDGGSHNSSSSKSRLDPEAKRRLDQLKLDSDVVHMSQKWVGRIKILNVEASQSLAAAEQFPELAAPLAMLSNVVEDALEKFALSGPIVPMSPSMKSTRLGMLGDKLQADRRSEATHGLSRCNSKKDLSDFDKLMAGHEGLLKKALSQLDKDVEHHQEQAEKERAMKELLQARLQKKKQIMESRRAKGRAAGLKQGKVQEELQSASGDGSDAEPGENERGHSDGEKPEHEDANEWRFAQEADALIRDKAFGVDFVFRGSSSDSVTFVNPTMLTSLDLNGFGFDQAVSDALYKEHVIGNDDEDDAADDAGDADQPKNLNYFKSVLASPVDEWTKSFPEVLEKLVAGVNAVEGLLEQDFKSSDWSKVLSGRIQYSGPRHKWMGFSDLLWGRLVWVVGGERVCVGMPLMAFQKDLADANADIGGITARFTAMSREEIKKSGGFACLVESGDVLVIPPGYLLADVNTGALDGCPVESEDAPADVGVFPVLTRDQLVNFDLGVYDAAIRLCAVHGGLCANFKHGQKMVHRLQLQLNSMGVKDEVQSPVRVGHAPKSASDPETGLVQLKPHDLQLVPWVSDDDDASVQRAVHEALSLVTAIVTNEVGGTA